MGAAAATVFLVLLAAAASAPTERCDVPVSHWKPREALRERLEAAGWQVRSITTKNGCYEAVVLDEGGHERDATFDPETLQTLKEPH